MNTEPWVIGAAQNCSGDGVADVIQDHMSGEINLFQVMGEAMTGPELDTFFSGQDQTAVVDLIVCSTAAGGTDAPGATFTDAGQAFEVAESAEAQLSVYTSGGFIVPTPGVVITGQAADGSTVHLTIPAEAMGDRPDITAISYSSVGPTPRASALATLWPWTVRPI